jgi:hypothetical protein
LYVIGGVYLEKKEIDELPKELDRFVDQAYGGLFGSGVLPKVIQEIVADPFNRYHPKEIEELTESSAPSVRKALANLTKLGLLIKDSRDQQHPIFIINPESKRLIALTLLAYATLDDRDGSECMDDAIVDYYFKNLIQKTQPTAIATAVGYQYKGKKYMSANIIDTTGDEVYTQKIHGEKV